MPFVTSSWTLAFWLIFWLLTSEGQRVRNIKNSVCLTVSKISFCKKCSASCRKRWFLVTNKDPLTTSLWSQAFCLAPFFPPNLAFDSCLAKFGVIYEFTEMRAISLFNINARLCLKQLLSRDIWREIYCWKGD